jgi:hypothetical protein
MLFRIFITCIAISISSALFGQMTPKAADEFFKMGMYDKALSAYERLQAKDTANMLYNYRLGVCHLTLTNDRAKAIPFLELSSTQKGVPDYVWFDLGSAYRYAHQYDKAKECLQKFLSLTRNNFEKGQAELMLKQLDNASALINRPVNVEFKNLGSNINSEFDDFYPYVDKGNKWIVFNSRRVFNKIEEIYVVNVHNAEFKRNEWKRAGRSKSVNSAEDNFIVGKSVNDDFIFIKPNRFEIFDDILMIDINNGAIGARTITMPAPINSKDEESGATLSASGDTLIFSSGRKGGFGELDLYMSIKLPDNSWGTPVNLGNQINTPYDEDYPMFSADGKSLYFASQGHSSMGGFDIFVSKLNESDGTWSAPRNLGYPINNFYDNYTISFLENRRYAYVADVRPGGLGGYDIYQVVFKNEESSVYILKGTISKGSASNRSQLATADNIQLSVYDTQNNELVGKYRFDYSAGRFFAAMAPGKYVLKIESKTCKTVNHPFEIPDMHTDEEFDLGEIFIEANE